MLITLHYFAMSDTPGDFLRASVSSGDVLWRQKRRHINDKRHTNVFDDMCLTMFTCHIRGGNTAAVRVLILQR